MSRFPELVLGAALAVALTGGAFAQDAAAAGMVLALGRAALPEEVAART